MKLLEGSGNRMGYDGGTQLAFCSTVLPVVDRLAIDPLGSDEARPYVNERRTPAAVHPYDESGLSRKRDGSSPGQVFRNFQRDPLPGLATPGTPDD
jgi:hypothetical protein